MDVSERIAVAEARLQRAREDASRSQYAVVAAEERLAKLRRAANRAG